MGLNNGFRIIFLEPGYNSVDNRKLRFRLPTAYSIKSDLLWCHLGVQPRSPTPPRATTASSSCHCSLLTTVLHLSTPAPVPVQKCPLPTPTPSSGASSSPLLGNLSWLSSAAWWDDNLVPLLLTDSHLSSGPRSYSPSQCQLLHPSGLENATPCACGR